MKRIVFLLIAISVTYSSFGSHITGGELMYTYLGQGSVAGTDRYRVTLRLFRDCFSSGPLLQGEQVRVGIYSNSNNGLLHTLQLPLASDISTISLNTNNVACLIGSPRVCYQIAYYSNVIDLEKTPLGYTLVQTACCRIGGITNIGNSNNSGATYTTRIPGTNTINQGNNNSPQFILKDTALVCTSKMFKLAFSATDVDGDSLSYSFEDAYGNVSSNNQPLPGILTLSSVTYQGMYLGASPLGAGVTINPTTGIISGRAPATGRYVVAVNVKEWRAGILINNHRKDFILSVQQCDYVSADLPEFRVACESFTVDFENASYSSLITSYSWSFGDPSTNSDVSNSPEPSYTYPDTGTYRVKLVVQGSNGCIDSTEADVAVYPGFKVDFGAVANCVNNPASFTDSSVATYGSINSWKWDFGETNIQTDTSSTKNPLYKYATTGSYQVKLEATSTKGCEGSATKTVIISDKAFVQLAFKDTIICGYDSIQLKANGNGIFSWSPNTYMVGGNTSSPVVYPPGSTSYVVTVNDNNCIGTDTVNITKLNSISVSTAKDTLICTGDSINLYAYSAANIYAWTPADAVNNASSAFTSSTSITNNTSFSVTATLGKCTATSSFMVTVAPYPVANAGSDISICPGTKGQLTGFVQADNFTWTPNYAMLNGNTLFPQVAPTNSTNYVLTAKYLTGCPKPVSDTVRVNVFNNPLAFAGNDTAFVVNQPIQLQATGGLIYQWSPAIYLSNSSIANPVVNMPPGIDTLSYLVKVTDENGCIDYDNIMLTRFRTGPTMFVPTAFTPNADGKNDILRPILAGIKQLEFFRVYNRWGQLIFETREPGKGWNGTINGKEQSHGTYVFVIQAVDYLGTPVQQKGTVVLIR